MISSARISQSISYFYMDSLGLFPPSIANLAGITLDLTRVYSLSANGNTVSKTVDAGIYFIIVTANDATYNSNGSLVIRSNDDTIMYCASSRCYFRFRNATTLTAYTMTISSSISLSAIWIDES